MRRPEPTPQELRAAWERCRKPSWPASFAEAMADPLLSRLVRITAMHPPRPYRVAPTYPLRTPPDRVVVAWGSATGKTQQLAIDCKRAIDRKRAAAGDRDDD